METQDGSSVQFGKTQYWDERYAEDTAQFDWYLRWAALAPTVEKRVRKDVDVLARGPREDKTPASRRAVVRARRGAGS